MLPSANPHHTGQQGHFVDELPLRIFAGSGRLRSHLVSNHLGAPCPRYRYGSRMVILAPMFQLGMLKYDAFFTLTAIFSHSTSPLLLK